MPLPGSDWLGDHLRSLQETGGGFETMMVHPVNGGAILMAEVALVVAWLVALPFLCLFAGVRALARWLSTAR